MSSKGYYTATYESARSSSKSNKKAKRAQRRNGEEKKRQASRSESRHEDKTSSSKKQPTVASSDTNKQRHAEAISPKRQESTKSERRDAQVSHSKDRQPRKPVQNKVDAFTMTERDTDGEGAYQKVLSVLSESFLQISNYDKEKRPERWAQYAHSRKVLYWLQEITRISKAALNMLSTAAGRAATPAEWKSLATLVSYLIDVASIFCRYGHPDNDLDGEVSGVVSELNKHLGEAQVNTKREVFKPVAGTFLRLHAALAAGKLGKRSGTVFFQTRAAGLEFKLVVHECTRRLQMMSCDEYARRTYPYDGAYQDGKVVPLELNTPVGFRAMPLRMFMKNELVEVLLNNRRFFDMQTTKFPTFGDLPPTPWIGATLQAAGWSKSKRAKRAAMDMSRALQRIAGSTADEVVEVVDIPHHPLSQADYEQLTECPYQRYRPNVATGPLSAKREAQSPAGANSSKKHRHIEPAPRPAVSDKPDAVVTVTLDGEEKPAIRAQIGRLHSDPHPCPGSQEQGAVDLPPTGRVQPSTSTVPLADTPPSGPATAELAGPVVPPAVILPPVTTAEPPAAPSQQSVAAEVALNIAAAAEPVTIPPVPAAPTLDVPAQPTERPQDHSEVYESTAQFSPAVEPQPYGHVDIEDIMGPQLPSMPRFWQQNELTPILLTDQEVIDQQDEQDDMQVPTPPTPQAVEALGETDEEV